MTHSIPASVYDGYVASIELTAPNLPNRLADITNGRVAPAVDDLRIGSARRVRAVVIFFDIRGFTKRTKSSDDDELRSTLFMLNSVIPAMMRVLYRHGAYVEKNTGDGLMGVLGIGEDGPTAARSALAAASEMLYVLGSIVNPFLARHGIEPVDARVGLDMGDLLLARIGTARGSADHDRSYLTAVGPAANLACKIQGLAGTNQIYCGDLLRHNTPLDPQRRLFLDVTPDDWAWIYQGTTSVYSCWRYLGETTKAAPEGLAESLRRLSELAGLQPSH
ncbi:class 3 adenylate cyclase [Stenotrophomonas sp. AG209]|uniref:adenylate/guanylate cyclase domain-containing protein n=1 Tax=Stenotrophomonas sp. AG209 TaxID=2183909 RepID=UPI000EEC5AB5|nr:adenylate/guanylate cyclase domain-containing protein [Stenotrophomonas sp. AG209]RIA32412.1 class 3 adenylate cyclase [Stenotrophomonas sp. AG209]